jgi:hypothetical protein
MDFYDVLKTVPTIDLSPQDIDNLLDELGGHIVYSAMAAKKTTIQNTVTPMGRRYRFSS